MRKIIFLLLILILFISNIAYSETILSAKEIIIRMQENSEMFKDATFNQIMLWRDEQAGKMVTITAYSKLYVKPPYKTHLEMEFLEENHLIISNEEGCFEKTEKNEIIETLRDPSDLLLFDFYYLTPEQIIKELKSQDIDVNKVCIAKEEDSEDEIYIIGADSPDEAVTQVWINIEHLLMVRLVQAIDAGNGNINKIHTRFGDYQLIDDIYWYPFLIATYIGDEILSSVEVKSVEVNSGLDESLFEMKK